MAIDYTTNILSLYAGSVISDAEYIAVPAARRNQASEQSILTTIEVLRSHIANLSGDGEARMLQYCLSRMLAAIGESSGLYDDVSVYAPGNNPSITSSVAVGDTVSVTTDSGTDAVSIATALTTRVVGTVATVADDATNGDTVDITTDSGTDNVTLAAGPFANIAALVTDINGQIATATEVEAYDADGVLGFRNATGSEGVSFTLAAGGGATSVLTRAGITAGTFTPSATMTELLDDINDQLTTAVEVEAYDVGYSKIGFRNTDGNEGVAFTLAVGAGTNFLGKAGIEPGDYQSPVAKIADQARDDALSHFTRVGNPEAL